MNKQLIALINAEVTVMLEKKANYEKSRLSIESQIAELTANHDAATKRLEAIKADCSLKLKALNKFICSSRVTWNADSQELYYALKEKEQNAWYKVGDLNRSYREELDRLHNELKKWEMELL